MSGRHIAELSAIGLVERCVRGFDGDLPAVRHGVARVDDEIDDGVFELAHIHERRPEAAAEDGLDRDRLPHRAGQHLRQAADQAVEVDLARAQDLLAGECEQTLRQRCGPPRALHRGRDRLADRRGFGRAGALEPALGRVEVADDDGHQIVEVVGDAAGELANRLHLLRLRQRGLRILADARLLRQRVGALPQFADESGGDRECGEGSPDSAGEADQNEAEHDRAPGRFGGLPLAEEIALCIVDLADERLDGIKRRLAPPRRDEPDRLVEPAAAAKVDRLRRFRQQNVDVGAHPVDPRDLVGIVGDKRPELLHLFRGRRSGSLIGAEKRVRSRQQIAALG